MGGIEVEEREWVRGDRREGTRGIKRERGVGGWEEAVDVIGAGTVGRVRRIVGGGEGEDSWEI